MLQILLTFALMASATTANKVILYSMTPNLLVGIRMFFAGLILFIYTSTHYEHKLTFKKIRPYIFLLLIVTACTTYLPSLLKSYALKNMVSSKAAFFGTLDPFITAIYAYFLYNEKLTIKQFAGIAVGFLGAIILIVSTSQMEDLPTLMYISLPEAAAILAVIISRYGWILVQKLLKNETFIPAQINTLTMLLSGIISLSIAYINDEFHIKKLTANLPILKTGPLSYFSDSAQLSFFVLYTIIIGNVIAYDMYGHVLKKYKVTLISLTGFSIPLFIHFYGWIFLNEKLSFTFLISCIITFIGLLIFSYKKSEYKQ